MLVQIDGKGQWGFAPPVNENNLDIRFGSKLKRVSSMFVYARRKPPEKITHVRIVLSLKNDRQQLLGCTIRNHSSLTRACSDSRRRTTKRS